MLFGVIVAAVVYVATNDLGPAIAWGLLVGLFTAFGAPDPESGFPGLGATISVLVGLGAVVAIVTRSAWLGFAAMLVAIVGLFVVVGVVMRSRSRP